MYINNIKYIIYNNTLEFKYREAILLGIYFLKS